MNGYTSDILYHFVGRNRASDHNENYRTLCKILDTHRVSYPPHDDESCRSTSFIVNWGKSLLSQDLIVPNVTCFCDIPFQHLEIHTSKYGQFGLGFAKDLLIYRGARPVIYIPYHPRDRLSPSPYGTYLLDDICQVYKSFEEEVVDKLPVEEDRVRVLCQPSRTADAAMSGMSSVFGKDFLAFIKAYDSTLSDDHPENYYMEREWRKFLCLTFQPHEVQKVVVPKAYVDRMKNEMPTYRDRIFACPTTGIQ